MHVKLIPSVLSIDGQECLQRSHTDTLELLICFLKSVQVLQPHKRLVSLTDLHTLILVGSDISEIPHNGARL